MTTKVPQWTGISAKVSHYGENSIILMPVCFSKLSEGCVENHPAYAGYPVQSANLQPGVYHPFTASNLVVRIPSAKNPHLRKTANHREGRKDMRRRYDSGADQRGADIIDLSLDRGDPYSIKVSRVFLSLFP